MISDKLTLPHLQLKLSGYCIIFLQLEAGTMSRPLTVSPPPYKSQIPHLITETRVKLRLSVISRPTEQNNFMSQLVLTTGSFSSIPENQLLSR